ncbi:MAG: hypothetical protein CK426_08935 [Legionella sp.]|nr:MAG: hypothetical protein CK423_08985 [Legionella sp.]PJD96975.1 MAG: hypothetical protein CK426_08935 [Legionella sp.]
MKPYRIINTHDLTLLSQKVNQQLHQWSEEFALHPLYCSLSLPAKESMLQECISIEAEKKTIACSENNLIALLQYAVFNHQDACFTPASHALATSMLGLVFTTDVFFNEQSCFHPIEWSYSGSTCLQMTLYCGLHRTTLFLSPSWVYQQLPPLKKKQTGLSSLEHATQTISLPLTLELEAFSLPLQQLLELKNGDVLVSDHAIESPLALVYNKKHIAHATHGKTSHFKSLSIKH